MIEENAAPTEPMAADLADSAPQRPEVVSTPEAVLDAETLPEAALARQATEAVEATEEAPAELPSLSLQALKPKMELNGVVKRVELFGAFVDIGVGKDALVHISQISEEPVKNVNDVLTAGQPVTVWVRQVDAERERIDVTMIKPLGVQWSEIRVGQVVTGKIVRVEKFGVFLEIGAERPGMVHVSELSLGYVGSPEDVYKVDEELTAKVIKVNSRKKQIDLSVKALEAPSAAAQSDDEDDENVPNAIELALRRALLNSEDADFPELERALESRVTNKANNRRGKKRDKRAGSRQQQEELLTRTLDSGIGREQPNAN